MATDTYEQVNNMEQETKHKIPSKDTADEIWNHTVLGDYGKLISHEEVVMKAVYFDTEDQLLRKNNIAMRVRCEGKACFATLKWGAMPKEIEGLHRHQEINVPVDGDTCFIAPPSNLFTESIDGQNMEELIKDRQLQNLFETRFLRKRAKITYESSIVELSIDEGSIVTDKGDAPIMEMEIELMTGSLSDIVELADKIANKYGLKAENKSKYARAMELLA